MATDKNALKLLIASILIIVAVELVVGKLAHVLDLSQPLIMVGAARAMEILLMMVLAYGITRSFSIVGLAPERLLPGLKAGLFWSFVFAGLVVAAGAGIYFFAGVNPLGLVAAQLPESMTGRVLIFLIGGILGPAAEELFFRGICYGYFRKWGILSAIIITTGIFVVAHSIKSAIPVPQIVGGIVFALSYERSKSLITPVIIHVLGNLAIFTLSLI